MKRLSELDRRWYSSTERGWRQAFRDGMTLPRWFVAEAGAGLVVGGWVPEIADALAIAFGLQLVAMAVWHRLIRRGDQGQSSDR